MISETVFEARFSQAEGLCRMGADIRIEGEGLRFSAWSGSLVRRFCQGFALWGGALCAALAAEGESLVHGAEYGAWL